MMNILADIQSRLNVPKSQFNAFGKYNYRNCEDILEALKPLLAEHEATLVIRDEIVLIGDRYYVKATAILATSEINYSSDAFAREAENKKGMDDAQVTGAASSYARKYALNGLFAIDDTKDADTTNKGDKGEKEPKKEPPPKTEDEPRTDAQNKRLRAMIGSRDTWTSDNKNEFYDWLKKNHATTITVNDKLVITKKSISSLMDNFDKHVTDFIEYKLSPKDDDED